MIAIPRSRSYRKILPPMLKGFAAVPPFVTDINLSLDDKYLYVSCWGSGEFRQYDVSDPFHPKLHSKIAMGGIVRRAAHPSNPGTPLNGGPQMVELSRDGRRVYVTNSLYAAVDRSRSMGRFTRDLFCGSGASRSIAGGRVTDPGSRGGSFHLATPGETRCGTEFEEVLRGDWGRAFAGVGVGAEWRKAALGTADSEGRSRRWREYCCERLLRYGGVAVYSGIGRHDEFTLGTALAAGTAGWWF